jgi:hypothetical protein
MRSKILVIVIPLIFILTLIFGAAVPVSAAKVQISPGYAQQLIITYPWTGDSLQTQLANCQIVVNYLDQHTQMVQQFYMFHNYLFKLESEQIIVKNGKSYNDPLCTSYPNSGLSKGARIQMCQLVLNYDQWEFTHFNANYMTMSSIVISQGFYSSLLSQLTH